MIRVAAWDFWPQATAHTHSNIAAVFWPSVFQIIQSPVCSPHPPVCRLVSSRPKQALIAPASFLRARRRFFF